MVHPVIAVVPVLVTVNCAVKPAPQSVGTEYVALHDVAAAAGDAATAASPSAATLAAIAAVSALRNFTCKNLIEHAPPGGLTKTDLKLKRVQLNRSRTMVSAHGKADLAARWRNGSFTKTAFARGGDRGAGGLSARPNAARAVGFFA